MPTLEVIENKHKMKAILKIKGDKRGNSEIRYDF